MLIDVSFDFRTDAHGKDPDAHSPTLRQYHKLLWSKALPNGTIFDLDDSVPRVYLRHKSDLGHFALCSDSVIQTFTRWASLKYLTGLLPQEENDRFMSISYTIGGMMIFPGNRIGGRQTINGARGFKRAIADRFDLTLECIRRHYLDLPSPLASDLARYADFFALFEDFDGYVEFFLLQDMATEDGRAVKFFLPFDDFKGSPRPNDRPAYEDYRRRSIAFVQARNARIAKFAAASAMN
jgi:hypothetical protein